MGSVWLSLRADLRGRWQGLLGLAVLLGLIGGVVLAAAAGARRTDTAYPRLLRWANAAQVNILNGPRLTGYDAALARLPQVASVSTASVYSMALPVRHGLSQRIVQTFSSPDQSLGVSADRVKILQGRMFNPRAAGQAMIDQQLAGLEHLRPGGTLHLLVIPDSPTTGSPEPRLAVTLAFRVSAVVAFDTQIVPATRTNSEPMALLGAPFAGTRLARSSAEGIQTGLRLRPGASMTSFLAAAATLAKSHHIPTGAFNVVSLSDEFTTTERAIRPAAIALAAFAGLLALTALATIGQLLSRQLILDAAQYPILRALGMTRAMLAALSLARAAAVTVVGGVIAVAGAIAVSPLMPIGPARLAEPSPGVEVNAIVLGAGFIGVALLPLAVLVPTAWRAVARTGGPLGVAEPAAPARASRLGRVLGLAGTVTGSVGVRMSFESGRGRTAVPERGALVGTTVAIGAVVAALVFGASLISLVSTPHRYGQDWDQELDLGFGGVPAAFGAKILSREPAVTGFAAGDYGQVSVSGESVAAIGVDPLRGPGYFTMLAGRRPVAPDEIVLGAQTMRAVHRRLGQTVRVVVNLVNSQPVRRATARIMRIVGVAVFASFSRGTFTGTDLGNGAAVPASVLSEPFQQAGCGVRSTCYNFFLVRYRAGTDQHAAAARLNAAATAAGCPPGSCLVIADQRPSDIQNYAGVRDTPLVLGAVLALLAVGTLVHVLLTGVRRRRRDLAVLKTIGLTRPQVIRVVSWQASALAAAALLVGVPLGLLAGRWAWLLFAGSVGVGSEADIPVPLMLLGIPATLLLANLIAAGPGWAAARIRPAVILRSE